ncbi:HAD family hydrolase [Adhaeretor mobilis]|uniref:Pyrophosphatase PpaX n=1 Tax=Adhaeretor mobilis TaxID=1930276 RepID=A0A517MRJ9_9BACT|nr:HAD hydrolase-like protein [Adhaeretor mobilis]QDS97510.1 Pyrophosphatase PpaX [Adhaeretor mobilis]
MYAVLFDIDGTLILTGGSGQVAFSRTFAEDFGLAEISRDVPFAGRSDRAIALDLMQHGGIEPSDANWRKFQTGYLSRLPSTLEELNGRVLPGVFELLDRLTDIPDVALGLLTGNMQRGAQEKLTYYNLWDRFAFGGYGDTATDRAHIAAQAAAQATQHSQENGKGQLCGTMVLGDTIHDVRCGKSIGALTVAIPTGNADAAELRTSEPDLLIDDLTQTDPLLQAITAALNEFRATA